MTSYEQRLTLLEFLYRKPGVTLPDVSEAPETLAYLIRDVFDDLQRSKVQLREQVTSLEERNNDLEDYAYMVAHDLLDSDRKTSILADVLDILNRVSSRTRHWYVSYRKNLALR